MNKEELLKRLKAEQVEKNYTLIINKSAQNKELMLLKKEHLEGAKKYYPQKEFESLLVEEDLNTILEKLEELQLTDYDVVFIDLFDVSIFYLIEQYILTFTGVKSLVIESRCRNAEGKALKKVVERVKNSIDEVDTTYSLSLFDQLLLGKDIEEIKEYAKSKNIELILE